jgi:membrane-bound serine protease (ClpP class)
VNYAGLALVLLGIGFLVAEAFVPSFGALGVGGVVAFGFGAVILMDTESPGWGIPPALIGALAVASLVFVAAVGTMAARARQRPAASGMRTLVGVGGELVEFADGQGWALVQGVHWRVHGPPGLRSGDHVRVTGSHESVLDVEAA